jgi:hypothetical protein
MSSTKKTKPGYRALTPKSETARRFTHWFNHGWESIEKTPTSWTTITEYPLSRREIWNRHQDPSKIIGLRFGTTTRFLALDIDIPSPYHPANDPAALGTIKAALEKVGLCRHVFIQSSHNGGVHLYTPLPAAVPTFKAACVLKAALERAGLKIEKGKLEIFPNPKRYAKPGEEPSRYNGLRLPLQPGSGSYLLDDDFNPVSDRVEDFLDQMEHAAAGQDLKTFKARLNPAYKKYKAGLRRREDNNSKSATEWKRDLETTIADGWTGYGQTNTLLIEFVTYTIVFLRLQGRELRERVKEQVINAPGYQTYCRHQHEIDRRIEQICYYTERNRYYLPYRNHPERDTTFEKTYHPVERQDRKTTSKGEDALFRLTATVAYIEETYGKLPDNIAERRDLIQTTAKERFGKGFSITTLSRREYLPHWHREYRDESERAPRSNETHPVQPPEPVETPEPAPDKSLYRSAPPEPVEPATPETEAGQEFVSIAPLYEVSLSDPTGRPETESPVSENSVSHLPVLSERSEFNENPSSNSELPSPRKRKPRWEKLTLVQRLEKWKARKIPLVYTGSHASGLVETRETKRSLVHSIVPEAIVLISDLNHSSVWFHPEDEDNLQIYVKPIDRGKEWKTGIAVLAKYLQPLDL